MNDYGNRFHQHWESRVPDDDFEESTGCILYFSVDGERDYESDQRGKHRIFDSEEEALAFAEKDRPKLESEFPGAVIDYDVEFI